MEPDADIPALIEDIYATGLGEQSWDPVLKGIRLATGSRLVGLLTMNGEGHTEYASGSSDDDAWAAELTDGYNREFHLHDPSVPVVRNWAAGRWYDDREQNAPEWRARSVIHQEFLVPRRASHWEGTFVHRTPDVSHFLSLIGDGARKDGGSFRSDVQSIRAHLARALRMRTSFDELQGKIAQGEATFDALSAPAFLLDDQRRLVRANAAGLALMKREPRLNFVHGYFVVAGYTNAVQWQAACKVGLVIIPGLPRELILSLSPVPAQTHLASDKQRPLILMMAPGLRSAAERQRRLCLIYGLTEAEAEVCMLLCEQGLTPQQCADAREVSVGTIRSQIKRVFFKTNSTRFFELMRLVSAL
ncbi:hypothetical protein DBV14_17610 [Variovorax sp. KBW07]|uniref:helix-turn-helix transcriptional regulator n=1 Tax=Variovorax sp. KBW07 TaxID=2153358 RepID=UPI000F5821F8|nr:helix-turn-helix transcriptional regulator [Variovorax sp. KBW07]RQO50941.1 hypothetical protein DBV14_17610 [Variovorax sp. KBW07]